MKRGASVLALLGVNALLLGLLELASGWLLERWTDWPKGERRPVFEIDPHLLWRPADYDDRLKPLHTRPGRRVIVNAGDSVTMGLDVPAGREYSSLLEACLGSESWASLNLGVEGYSTFQTRRVIERVVPLAHPEVVTLFAGWNDHWRDGRVPDAEVSPTALRLRAWARRLKTGQLLDRFSIHLARPRLTWVTRVPLPAFELNLRAVRDFLRAHGTRLILVMPVYFAPAARSAGVEDVHLQYLGAMRRVVAEGGIQAVDLVPAFLERADLFVPDPAFAPMGGVDYVHPNESGHALLARELCREVREGPGRSDAASAGEHSDR